MNVFAADCEKSLFGWDAKNNERIVHINGVFGNEGGYQNLPNDAGNFRNGKNCGGTKFGITCRDHAGIRIKSLTREEAAQIYRNDQWKAIHGEEIISQYLAYKLLDLAINTGAGNAIKLLEKTINDLNGAEPDLQPTGIVSPEMIDWLNAFTADQQRRWWFFDHLKLQALERYISIVDNNPKNKQFFLTWTRRDILDE